MIYMYYNIIIYIYYIYTKINSRNSLIYLYMELKKMTDKFEKSARFVNNSYL